MADDDLHVELVQADRLLWSGDSHLVITRSVSGDLGIMPGHEPLMTVLADGVVHIRQQFGDGIVAAVLGGFLSVADNRVSILAEHAELAGNQPEGLDQTEAINRAQARLSAAEHA
jgi:F-type H+-transporting ATPase subunit epsilon